MEEEVLREIGRHIDLADAISAGNSIRRKTPKRVVVSSSLGPKVLKLKDLEEELAEVRAWIPRLAEECSGRVEKWDNWRKSKGKGTEVYTPEEAEEDESYMAEVCRTQVILRRLRDAEYILERFLQDTHVHRPGAG